MDTRWNDLLLDAERRLDQGLYLDNVTALINAFRELAILAVGSVRVAAWVAHAVLVELTTSWDDQPLQREHYDRETARLVPCLKDIVRVMRQPDIQWLALPATERLVCEFVEIQEDARMVRRLDGGLS